MGYVLRVHFSDDLAATAFGEFFFSACGTVFSSSISSISVRRRLVPHRRGGRRRVSSVWSAVVSSVIA
jgi:hypothetical protein